MNKKFKWIFLVIGSFLFCYSLLTYNAQLILADSDSVTLESTKVNYDDNKNSIMATVDSAKVVLALKVNLKAGQSVNVTADNDKFRYQSVELVTNDLTISKLKSREWQLTAKKDLQEQTVKLELSLLYGDQVDFAGVKTVNFEIGDNISKSITINVDPYVQLVPKDEIVKKVSLGINGNNNLVWVIYFNYNQKDLGSGDFSFFDNLGPEQTIVDGKISVFDVHHPLIKRNGVVVRNLNGDEYDYFASAKLLDSASATSISYQNPNTNAPGGNNKAYYIMIETIPSSKSVVGKTFTNSVSVTSVAGNDNDTATVHFDDTNNKVILTKDINGEIQWTNDNHHENTRPASVKIHLWANGVEKDSQTLTAANGWKYEFKNQPKLDTLQQKINYTVTLDSIPNYTTTKNGDNFINEYQMEQLPINGSIHWNDKGQVSLRPQQVVVTLTNNNTNTIIQRIATMADNWQYDFGNLPKYDSNGQLTQYSISVAPVSDYSFVVNDDNSISATYQNSHEDSSNSGNNGSSNNTPIYPNPQPPISSDNSNIVPAQLTIQGTKIWDDDNNRDGLRPQFITLHLLANGQIVQSKIVTAADDWQYSFNNLSKYDDQGQEINYSIDEESVTGYIKNIKGYNIINQHLPEVVNIAGTKIWNDDNNRDGLRPANTMVYLLANNQLLNSQAISAVNNWQYAFSNLPKYDNQGQLIQYSLSEEPIAGYSSIRKGNDLIGQHFIEQVNVSGQIDWNDYHNQDQSRPPAITVNLLANGQVIKTQLVASDNNWQYTFSNLPKYQNNGQTINYAISTATISAYNPSMNGYNITMNHFVNSNSTKVPLQNNTSQVTSKKSALAKTSDNSTLPQTADQSSWEDVVLGCFLLAITALFWFQKRYNN